MHWQKEHQNVKEIFGYISLGLFWNKNLQNHVYVQVHFAELLLVIIQQYKPWLHILPFKMPTASDHKTLTWLVYSNSIIWPNNWILRCLIVIIKFLLNQQVCRWYWIHDWKTAMDWLDDLLEIHFPIGLVYCFSCSDCPTKPESSNLFSVCWLFTGKYLFHLL